MCLETLFCGSKLHRKKLSIGGGQGSTEGDDIDINVDCLPYVVPSF